MTNITVSLEIAKKLKEAGFNADALLCREYITPAEKHSCQLSMTDYTEEPYQEARVAQEILDELPTVIEVWRIEYMLTMTKKSALYLDLDIEWWFHTRATLIVFDWDNLAEALAELRLRSKENGYLSSKTDE